MYCFNKDRLQAFLFSDVILSSINLKFENVTHSGKQLKLQGQACYKIYIISIFVSLLMNSIVSF